MTSLLIPIFLILAGLLVGVLFKSLSKYITVPYTVVLFAVGIAVGLMHRYNVFGDIPLITAGIEEVANLDPNFILYVFLPILVFDAAYEMNLHIFRKTLVNASILAGPGLVICMLLTACFLQALYQILPGEDNNWSNWTYAFMFGGLISATDPVAVVALLQELKTSKRFSTLVDGESLLNDGTGIVCFMLFYSAFAGEAINMSPFLYFLWVCIGSIIIGFLIARITLWFITRVTDEEVIQNSVMIIAAYITFIIAQYAFDISGVIALVVYGQHVAQKGRPHLKPQVNIFMEKFWGLMAYIANTLIFIIVGIIISSKVDITLIRCIFIVLIYVGIILIRYIMIYMLYPLLKTFGYGISLRESVILGWGGLRGALGMSLALMVYSTESIPEEVREDILLMTAGIVTLTLCINATTSKFLLRKLGLIKTDSIARSLMYKRIHNYIRNNDESALEAMKQSAHLQEADWEEVAGYIPEAVDEMEITAGAETKTEASGIESDTISELRIKILDKERETVNTIYESGIISQLSYSTLLETIDDLYDSEGTDPLNRHVPMLSMKPQYWLLAIRNFQKAINFFPNSQFCVKFYESKVSKKYDLCRGFILTQESALELIDNIGASNIIDQAREQVILGQLRKEVTECIDRANLLINNLKESFPKSFSKAVTVKAVRMLKAGERSKVIEMFQKGIITEEDMINLLSNISKRHPNK